MAAMDSNCRRPIRFLNYLVEHRDFLSLVAEAWSAKCKGGAMARFGINSKGSRNG